jgi:hypothetical protein
MVGVCVVGKRDTVKNAEWFFPANRQDTAYELKAKTHRKW